MLKDLFKHKEKEQNKDPLVISIADGYVDIKGYKVHEDGTKELIYHDTGDNVVTDWMRHAIISLLGGYVYSKSGNYEEKAKGYSRPFTSADGESKFKENENHDGYIINGKQFLDTDSRNDIATGKNATSATAESNQYIMYPTKILFGTGKEYASFDALSAENSVVNQNWYNDIVSEYGGIQNASATFDGNISFNNNKFSGTIANNKHSGVGTIVPCRTVNDPDTTSSVIPSSATMAKNYNVVGAVKTPYMGDETTSTYLMPSISEVGKLLKPEYRGIGRPCFIYFTQHTNLATATSEIFLSKDSSADFLSKITFKVVMPAQNATNNAIGKYYPYNGYTLKQMGLYNDALLDPTMGEKPENTYAYSNMCCGMLLALKNITSFTKTDDNEMTITWTLTI
jgi:hypothetical protein